MACWGTWKNPALCPPPGNTIELGSLPSTRTPHGNKECAMADTFWVWGTIKGETVTNECMKNEGKETFFPHLYYKTSAIIGRLNNCGVQQSCDNVHVFIDIEWHRIQAVDNVTAQKHILRTSKPELRSPSLQEGHLVAPDHVIPMAFNFPLWMIWLISQLVILGHKLCRGRQWLF